jgi:hypothetical protein
LAGLDRLRLAAAGVGLVSLAGLMAAGSAANAQSASGSASGIVHGYGVGLAGLSAPVSVAVTGQNGDVTLSNGVGAVLSSALLAASSQGLAASGGVGSGAQNGGVGNLNVEVSSGLAAAPPRSAGTADASAGLNGKVDLEGGR